ncbi:4-(cytidine 5'-diphospho)-2-C-methyl-D-erythritol kinase [Corynebacterium felinum]|uniref:4-diphosphocytidyl-2-C-methyl-D-erythritol kinase n=1 Tax=Corynebacterium felinum TaxID=131318 RepID=A0ABU2B8Z3_9CORY|nr:4-(cytidine 5'-diphospho)-2-C-methyl-D-erythritol kinase [Corynebacterium felinum]MDF5821541.1 4-(cytidine 5'-diphospho)-2-C-methyl-D-erythritol kinase [Corynebacterium felinum]MDR7355102.1 4-diphosphocytidyl-2-C-methyl-D-erythritol kinase [Corynebacterium felinum]WJY94452.1 4-diphosphocytidyl-2-C-methyl-D-erythritol kinase [Corynebacterium felinum]
MREIQATAHAKINLHLGVGTLRDDGYHDLSTIFCSLALHDTLTLTETEGHGVTKLTCPTPGVPENNTNLAWRGAQLILDTHHAETNIPSPGISLKIHKGIPTAGGMAGGSADAAAAMIATNELLGGYFSKQQLMHFGAQLGSDVPFTLLGGVALGTGRGEELTPVLTRGTYHFALAFAAEGLSTPEVFRKLDTLNSRTPHLDTTAVQQALARGDVDTLAAAMHNDMQAAALSLQPQLRRTLEIGTRAGALAGIVSGSGPTCAFLCDSAESALEVANELTTIGKATVTTGPAAGATLKD